MIENFDDWLCRCSGLGNVVTASGNLTDGAKTWLTDVFVSKTQGVTKEAYGKQIDKGIANEPDAFKMANDLFYPGRYLAKITTPKQNEFIKGTPDFIMDEMVTDIKNAYDRFTFGKADLTHIYKWQVKGYMNLYDLPKGRLFYCLINLPSHMVAQEQIKMFYTKRLWVSQEDPDYIKACEELEKAHNYDALSVWEKFKVWDMDRDEKDDQKIKDCISQARTYLNKLNKEYKERIELNKLLIKIAA